MGRNFRGNINIPGLRTDPSASESRVEARLDSIEAGDGGELTLEAGVAQAQVIRKPRRVTLTLTDIVVTVPMVGGFAGALLAALPAGRHVLLGASFSGSMVVESDNDPQDPQPLEDSAIFDVAVGRVETASDDFSGSGEKSLVAKMDTDAEGVIGPGDLAAVLASNAADSKEIWLNVAGAVGQDTDVTINGTIVLDLIDLQ